MTREEKRNKAANDVCKELRFQFARYGYVQDVDRLFRFLTKWMVVAKRDKYDRPKDIKLENKTLST